MSRTKAQTHAYTYKWHAFVHTRKYIQTYIHNACKTWANKFNFSIEKNGHITADRKAFYAFKRVNKYKWVKHICKYISYKSCINVHEKAVEGEKN